MAGTPEEWSSCRQAAEPRRRDPSRLSDAKWALLEPLLPPARPAGHPRTHPARELVDAVRYVPRCGITWRALPHEYPPWQTVSHSFRAWRLDGIRACYALRDRFCP
ncbi:MAG: transposase, partial [Chloroflexota bacterium]|nr:transposase [Chloroflexota bacterium]